MSCYPGSGVLCLKFTQLFILQGNNGYFAQGNNRMFLVLKPKIVLPRINERKRPHVKVKRSNKYILLFDHSLVAWCIISYCLYLLLLADYSCMGAFCFRCLNLHRFFSDKASQQLVAIMNTQGHCSNCCRV